MRWLEGTSDEFLGFCERRFLAAVVNTHRTTQVLGQKKTTIGSECIRRGGHVRASVAVVQFLFHGSDFGSGSFVIKLGAANFIKKRNSHRDLCENCSELLSTVRRIIIRCIHPRVQVASSDTKAGNACDLSDLCGTLSENARRRKPQLPTRFSHIARNYFRAVRPMPLLSSE